MFKPGLLHRLPTGGPGVESDPRYPGHQAYQGSQWLPGHLGQCQTLPSSLPCPVTYHGLYPAGDIWLCPPVLPDPNDGLDTAGCVRHYLLGLPGPRCGMDTVGRVRRCPPARPTWFSKEARTLQAESGAAYQAYWTLIAAWTPRVESGAARQACLVLDGGLDPVGMSNTARQFCLTHPTAWTLQALSGVALQA